MAEHLVDLFFEHKSKVVDKWEQYLGIYEVELGAFVRRGIPVKLLEVGVQNGGSLELWSKYLPPGSTIHGLDILPEVGTLTFDSPGIRVDVVDATQFDQVTNILGSGTFDIIIDDGSHNSSDIISTLNILFKYLAPGGRYIIEDLHCSYYPSHEGGYRRPDSSIEWLKQLIDSLNYDHIDASTLPTDHRFEILRDFNRTLARVSFFDSVVVLEKLASEKTVPYRRLCSGTRTEAFPFFDILSRAPAEILKPILFALPTAKKIEETLIDDKNKSQQRASLLEATLEAAHAKAASLEAEREAKRIAEAARFAKIASRHDRQIEVLRETVTLSDAREHNLKTRLAELSKELNRFRSNAQQRDFQISALKARTAWSEERRDISEAERAKLQDHLAEVARSASWRSTRPLRAASRALRWWRDRRGSGNATVEETPATVEGDDVYAVLANSGLFDAAYYLSRNPDIASGGVEPLHHFISYGAEERRDPNPTFNTGLYLDANPDVAASGLNPLQHYILYGADEDRVTHLHLDVDQVASNDLDVSEEQSVLSLFDPRWYLDRYTDVAAQQLSPFRHFIEHGLWENRDPNPLFSVNWYRTTYPDIDAAGSNPLLHYIKWGAKEGRQPCRGFNSLWYLEQYSDVNESGENPLAHYLRIGREIGYLPIDPNGEYRSQLIEERQWFAFELPELRRHIDSMLYSPQFLIYIEGSASEARDRTIQSLERQIYKRYSLVQNINSDNLINHSEEDELTFFIWLQAGDSLDERALYEFASHINSDISVDLMYTDSDETRDDIRLRPFYKPDWSPDYLESFNYIGSGACFRSSIAAKLAADSTNLYDFVLRCTERCERVAHIRRVLCHRSEDALNLREEGRIDAEINALKGRLQRTKRAGEITPVVPGLACYNIKLRLAREPLVSVVIPTAGKTIKHDGRYIDLLENCLNTIAERSTYKNLEFVIVDNGDLGEKRADTLRSRGCKLVTYSEPVFNVAKKLNLGASLATGEMLLLLNDDIEPLSPDWIERMLDHFEKPHVGVVGAKLLYPNETTQHVGVVLNSGNPDHVRRLQPRGDIGYFFSTCAARNFSAVTGACMLTRTDVYRDIGGYNEALSVSYNDVDYCLNLLERGLTVVYAPQAELIHFESQSRVARLDLEEIDYFARRWASRVTSDPYYNEDSLTVASPTFEVRHTLRQI